MSIVNQKARKWQRIAGLGVICSLAMVGCDRTDKEDNIETTDAITNEQIVEDSAVAPAINCDDPLVQDRLKTALKNTLNQQAQTLAIDYANATQISLNSDVLNDSIGEILIDIQNAALLQEVNTSGMTTCQASISMTLPSEDLYKASQMHTAFNKPSLQTRLAKNNIRINNNMLVDDAFSYVVGTQGGQVQARIAGQPTLITVVADVVAGSAFQSVIDEQQADRQQQIAAQRRANAQSRNETQTIRQPRVVTPIEPIAPARQAAPPTINQGNNRTIIENNANSQGSSLAVKPSTDVKAPVIPEIPKVAPSDDSIDMIIVEDDTATY